MCDKEAEEVYYKERDVHMAEKSGTNWNESPALIILVLFFPFELFSFLCWY